MLQGITSPGTVFVAIDYYFGKFIDQTPDVFLLIASFTLYPTPGFITVHYRILFQTRILKISNQTAETGSTFLQPIGQAHTAQTHRLTG